MNTTSSQSLATQQGTTDITGPAKSGISRLVCGICLAALVCVQPAISSAAPQPANGKELMHMIRERHDSRSQMSQVAMELIDQGGHSQQRELIIYARQIGEEEKTLTRFVAPMMVKGVGFLVLGENGTSLRYLYTPADKKTRLVPPGDNKKSFMGTDFTYYDLSPHDANGDVYQPLGSDSLDGFACWRCESAPGDAGEMYSRVIQWIRKDILVPIRIEFYDLDGKLLKISQVAKLEQIDGFWTPLESVMENVQTGHRTIMRIKKMAYNKDIPDQMFTRTSLEK